MQLENYVAISSVPGESGQFWQLALFVITLITRLMLIKKLCLKDVTANLSDIGLTLFVTIPPPLGSEGGLSRHGIVTLTEMLCLTIRLMFHSPG